NVLTPDVATEQLLHELKGISLSGAFPSATKPVILPPGWAWLFTMPSAIRDRWRAGRQRGRYFPLRGSVRTGPPPPLPVNSMRDSSSRRENVAFVAWSVSST